MIRFNGVSKSYGEKAVLRDLTFHIKDGEKVCLVGESGAGKTTALRLICGFEGADKGSVEVKGRISAVFQEDRLFESFSAYDNVRLVGGEEKAQETLKAVGLWEDREKKVSELSGGMARRVAIARALAYPFDILLLDEAFTGIDDLRKGLIQEYILENLSGKTLLLISHDEGECDKMCDRRIKIPQI
jgi:NitT/TauT family transport system ATP-binding protein